MKIYLIRLLVFLLGFEISGVTRVVAAPPIKSHRIQAIEEQERTMIEVLGGVPATGGRPEKLGLLIRSRHPNTLTVGRVDPVQLRCEATSLDLLLKKYQHDLEDVFQDRIVSLSWKLNRFSVYFSLLVRLIQIRTYLGMGSLMSQVDSLGLKIPYTLFTAMTGMSTGNPEFLKHLLNNASGIQVDWKSYEQARHSGGSVILRLSQQTAQVIESIALANDPTDAAGFKIARFAMLSLLYDDLENIRQLRRSPRNEVEPVPQELKEALSRLGNLDVRALESRQASQTPDLFAENDVFRHDLTQQLHQIPGIPPSLLKSTQSWVIAEALRKDGLTSELHALVGKNQSQLHQLGLEYVTPAFSEKLVQLYSLPGISFPPDTPQIVLKILRIAEQLEFIAALDLLMKTDVGLINTLPPSQQVERVKFWIAQAKRSSILPALNILLTPPQKGTRERDAIVRYLDQHTESFKRQIPDAFIENWLKPCRKQVNQQSARVTVVREAKRLSERKKVIEYLLAQASALSQEYHTPAHQLPVQVSLLHQALQSDYGKFSLTPTGAELMNRVVKAGQYLDAKRAYGTILVEGQKILWTHKQAPEQDQVLTQDLKSLKEIGHLFGFDQYFDRTPYLSELPLTQSQRDRYYLQILSQTPFTPFFTQEINKKKLFETLAEIHKKNQQNDAGFPLAEEVVERGLDQMESNIHQNIQAIAHAKTDEEFFRVVYRSPLMKNFIEESYPSLSSYYRKAWRKGYLHDIDENASVFHQGVQAYLGPMNVFFFLFMGKLLTQGFARISTSLVGGVETALVPKLVTGFERAVLSKAQGYLNLSLLVIFLDMGLVYQDTQGAQQKLEEIKRLYHTSFNEEDSFLEYTHIIEEQERIGSGNNHLIWMGVMQVGFLLMPNLFNAFHGGILKLQTHWRERQFKTIGINVKAESQVSASIRQSIWSEERIRSSAEKRIQLIERQSGELDAMARAQIREVGEARDSLLRLVEKDRQRAHRMGKITFAHEFQALGFKKGYYTFDLEEIDNALAWMAHSKIKLEEQLAAERTSKTDSKETLRRLKKASANLARAEMAAQTLYQAIRSEYTLSEPGPLSIWITGRFGGGRWSRYSYLDQFYRSPNTEFYLGLRERVFRNRNTGHEVPMDNEQVSHDLEVLGLKEQEKLILGLVKRRQNEDALAIIKKAYRKEAKKRHPDYVTHSDREQANRDFHELNESYLRLESWIK